MFVFAVLVLNFIEGNNENGIPHQQQKNSILLKYIYIFLFVYNMFVQIYSLRKKFRPLYGAFKVIIMSIAFHRIIFSCSIFLNT